MVGIKGLSQFSTGCLIIAICFQIIHLSGIFFAYTCTRFLNFFYGIFDASPKFDFIFFFH